MTARRIVAVSGSLSRPSRTRLLVSEVARQIHARVGGNLTFVDVAEIAPGLRQTFARPSASQQVEQALSAIEQANVVIAGSPVYKGSYSGFFKHLIDLVEYRSLAGVPVALLATGWRPSRSLRVHAGGEAVPPDLAATLLAHAESVWNGYGPTETTVYVSCTRLAPGEPVTIGRPLPGVRAYMLDAAGHLVPTGVAGELCVGGAGVALGYHARHPKPAEEGSPRKFAKPRHRKPAPKAEPRAGSPFAALAGMKFERR